MIKAGNKQINDSGFAVVMETISGNARQAVILELPGGIDDETLASLCAGPIEVLDADGNTVQSHVGPFRISTHSLKLVRTDVNGDVAALTARVTELEAELSTQVSAKESALNELASVTAQLTDLKSSMQTVGTVTTPVFGADNLQAEQ